MYRVLLVSDEETVLDRTAPMLERLGWEVYTAADEELAFQSLIANRPSMVVADVEMGGKAGFDTLLMARQVFPELFILAVTRGADDRGWPDCARAFGADSYAVGPVSAPLLARQIDSAVEQGLLDSVPSGGFDS